MKIHSLIFSAHLAVAGMVQSAVTHACGFENPEAIALGTLNVSYPDAVHVLAAVWRAEDAGLLMPRRGRADGSGPLAFYRATSAVKKLGTKITNSLPAGSGLALSVVLVPQVMWTRFEVGPEGLTVQSHAEGPQADDLVIVTEEKVARALADGELNPRAAEEDGLLRFYGNLEGIANVRAALTKPGEMSRVPPPALIPIKTR